MCISRALDEAVNVAARESVKEIDEAVLSLLRRQGVDARPREKVVRGRKFEDDIRIYAGNDEVSIEIENEGNRLEFDLLKMMTFAETVSKNHRAFGCLIIPASKQLGNPFISGNGKERIWDYLTKRLLPMMLPVNGLRIENVLVLGYERANQKKTAYSIPVNCTGRRDQSLKGLVRQAWISTGKPPWDIDRTLRVAIAADSKLEGEGQMNPAPKFRASRRTRDLGYLRQWVMGCKFEWLRKG